MKPPLQIILEKKNTISENFMFKIISLLIKFDADVNIQPNIFECAIHCIYPKIIELLLQNNISYSNKNNLGLTPTQTLKHLKAYHPTNKNLKIIHDLLVTHRKKITQSKQQSKQQLISSGDSNQELISSGDFNQELDKDLKIEELTKLVEKLQKKCDEQEKLIVLLQTPLSDGE